jgi:hypothetical protein
MTSAPRRLKHWDWPHCLAASTKRRSTAAAVLPAPDKTQRLTSHPHSFHVHCPGSSAPRVVCRACGSSSAVRRVAVPYVFRYLATELAAMNIKTTLAIAP